MPSEVPRPSPIFAGFGDLTLTCLIGTPWRSDSDVGVTRVGVNCSPDLHHKSQLLFSSGLAHARRGSLTPSSLPSHPRIGPNPSFLLVVRHRGRSSLITFRVGAEIRRLTLPCSCGCGMMAVSGGRSHVRSEMLLFRTLCSPSAARPSVRQSIPVNILSDKHGEICHEFIIPPPPRREGSATAGTPASR